MSVPAWVIVGTAILAASPAARVQSGDANPQGLFSRHDSVDLTIAAPLQQLFEKGTNDEHFSVEGTVSIANVKIPSVQIFVRGNTSKRETECPFPKLKLKFPEGRNTGGIFAGLDTVKIGTHCGEAADDELTKRFGRLANEKSPWREALVYRLLEAVGMPALKARPARITYLDTSKGAQGTPLIRNAALIEDDDVAKKRYGADAEISMEDFGSARERFGVADAARLAFAEAMVGNFDWCLKFTPEDTYRCDQRRPLWNILALQRGNHVFPLVKDFDIAGIVTGRHPWFGTVFNEAFVPSKSEIEIEVLSQVQRTRSLFTRQALDDARRAFMTHRSAAEKAIADATVDQHGRELARKYVRSFYDAIATDAAFYRRVVVRADTRLYTDASKKSEACEPGEAVPVGTPVNELRREQSMTEVLILDVRWRWAPPTNCDAVHTGPVWIESDAIGADYPSASRRPAENH